MPGLTSIITQGRHDYPQWVTSYTVDYGFEDSLLTVLNAFYDTVVYTANSDQNTRVENALPDGLIATRMRIYPQSWHGHPSMRAEVVTCTVTGAYSATS